MWFRGEFRAQIVEPGTVVAFIPSDENGTRRTGIVVRLHDGKATKIAEGWLATDRIFFYHELDSAGIDSGYFNDRTKERISLR
jgi:hypothetical protein